MHILAKLKDGIVEDVIVTPEIPADSSDYQFIDVTSNGAGPEILGKTAEQVTSGRAWSIMIEEPLVQRQPIVEEVAVVEETVAIVDEVAVVEEPAQEVAPE
jgi:hypothetical protein